MGQIYKHTSPSGKSYIGQTTRTWELRAGADPIRGYHSSTKFKNAIRKYGWDNFTHEILEDGIIDPNELNTKEKFWIEKLDSVKNGYNSLSGATGISYPSTRGIPAKLRNLSKETLETLYVSEGYSAKEIGEMFDSNHNSVIAALQINKIPRRPLGSPGKREREINKLKALKEIVCSICGNTFMPTKKDVQSCSRSCRSKLGAKRLGKSIEKIKVIHFNMNGTEIPSKSVGAIVAGHKRWHVKRNIVNPDCSLCVIDESLLQVS